MTRERRTAAVRVRRAAGLGLGVGLGICTAVGAWAQMHKVEKPEKVVRAVGVYEWTGDLTKPGASRLVPVTVFIDGELEDAGVYEPRPVPFALLPGNAYEVQQAGVAKGLVALTAAGKLPDTSGTFDDPWFGYGSFEPEAEVKAAALKQSRRLSAITTAKDDDGRAHFSNGADGGSGGNKADPDRPTLRRRSTTGKADSGSGSSGTGAGTDASATPADDPDRPVLKRHGGSAADAKKNGGTGATGATDGGADREVATETLNNDPDRPVLHRGRPSGAQTTSEEDAAKAEAATSAKLSAAVAGGPGGLHQMVAVSDAANRPEHDFLRPWADENEHAAVLSKMESLARAKLAAYAATAGGAASGAAAAGAGPGAAGKSSANGAGGAKTGAAAHRTGTAGTTPAARRRAAVAAAAAKRKAAAGPPPVALLDGDLKGYTLSYGGAPTFVYTAHTAGTGAALRYVTVVAQQDVTGQIVPAFGSVTDAAHLDRTPWMRLVGVVDVEASNRASLLFEMRQQGSRQFALYRVLGDRSEPLFTTGTTQ